MPRLSTRAKHLIALRSLFRRRLVRRIVRKMRRTPNSMQDTIDKIVYRKLKQMELNRYLTRAKKIESEHLTFSQYIPTQIKYVPKR